MIEYQHIFRVAYPDTDQMGTVHHANYVKFYEAARWEMFRSIVISYASIEEAGFLLPVIRMNYRFRKPTHYDALLRVHTILKEISGARMWFTYKLYNQDNQLINEAETELAFVLKDSWKPCLPPAFVLDAIEKVQKH